MGSARSPDEPSAVNISAHTQKLIGLAALLVWLHLLFGIYPLPPQAAADFLASLNQAPDPAIENAFWVQWLKSLLLMVAGVTSAFVAYRGFRYWKLAILATSALIAFPAAYYIVSDIVERGGLGRWWSLWVTVIGRFLERGELWSIVTKLYWLFFWPAYHLILVATVTVVFLLHRKRSNQVRDLGA